MRKRRRTEAAVIVGIMLLVMMVFWITDLDLIMMRWFFAPTGAETDWPYGHALFWSILYELANPIAGAVALVAIGLILVGTFRPHRHRLKPAGLCLFLCLLIGPGLLVNVVLKDYWGRPRPRQVEPLGGMMRHIPPGMIGYVGMGKSFPSGHASAAFILGVPYFLLYRRHRRLAWCVLGLGIGMGLLMGGARMAAGGHFPSDALMAGVVVLGAAWWVYHHLLRIPEREEGLVHGWGVADRRCSATITAAAAVALAGVLLVASPAVTTVHHRFDSATASRDTNDRPLPVEDASSDRLAIHLSIPGARLDVLVDQHADEVELLGFARGFGWKTSRIRTSMDDIELPDGGLGRIWRLEKQGVFVICDARLSLRLPPDELSRLTVALDKGRITVFTTEKELPDPTVLDRLRVEHGSLEVRHGELPEFSPWAR
ncbi:MAG: phosphatase PAP2 family protein [Phycisphaeraceae bacterium]|nr:phosphatase PAP2 family protein [Phycisphaeraceae bacterium]